MSRRAATAFVAMAIVLVGARPAAADDRTAAAEHFALAQAAERRSDWRSAIDEYEQAYRLQAHPSVLFNIGNGYEQLGDHRSAARYFLRYLDDAPDADDRDAVLERVRGLRRRPSRVVFVCAQPGAAVYVDDERRGLAPLEIELAAGSHRVWAELEGAQSTVRTVALEYGDRVTVTLDVRSRPGVLQVDSNVAGAEIRLDGDVIGFTPFAGEVGAGKHVVVVGMSGYASVERQVVVRERGSEQVRIQLTPIGGDAPGADGPTGKLLLATAYGYNTVGSGGLRLQFLLGYRTPNNRLEVAGLGGWFGDDVGAGGGGQARLFLMTTAVRPYVRAAGVFGVRPVGETGGRGIGIEAGAGILYSHDTPGNVGYEYFLEVNGQYAIRSELPEAAMDEDDGVFRFPLILGVALRLGSGE